MRFHYDKKKDALSIRFDESSYRESDEVQSGVIFDYDRKKKLIGIEILDASRKLSSSMRKSLSREEISLRIGAAV